MKLPLSIIGNLNFKIRFNTTHGDTDLYWRIIVNDVEYLVKSLNCNVNTHSDASFDASAGTIKYHIAGSCYSLNIDTNLNATLAPAQII